MRDVTRRLSLRDVNQGHQMQGGRSKNERKGDEKPTKGEPSPDVREEDWATLFQRPPSSSHSVICAFFRANLSPNPPQVPWDGGLRPPAPRSRDGFRSNREGPVVIGRPSGER